MIPPSLCQSTPAGSWARVSWLLLQGLRQPGWVIAILGAIALLSLALPRHRWRRLTLACSGGLLLLYLSILSPAVAQLGNRFLSAWVPPDSGQAVDAIVVLGRGAQLRPQRVAVVARLWQQQRAPLVFASGRHDALEIVQMLADRGLPAPSLEGEPCSATTEENAQFTAAILQPQGIHRILLVTDPPHMLRSQLTFQSVGFEVIPHMSPLPHRLKKPGEGLIVFREGVGLVAYGLMGRYFSRQVNPDASFPHQATAWDPPAAASLARPNG